MKTARKARDEFELTIHAFMEEARLRKKSGEIKSIFIGVEWSDSAVSQSALSDNYQSLIGMLEVAKHGYLVERREKFLEFLKEEHKEKREASL